jgi:hypothetical protein
MHVDPVVKQNNQRMPMSVTRQQQTGKGTFNMPSAWASNSTGLIQENGTTTAQHIQQKQNIQRRPPRHNNLQQTQQDNNNNRRPQVI